MKAAIGSALSAFAMSGLDVDLRDWNTSIRDMLLMTMRVQRPRFTESPGEEWETVPVYETAAGLDGTTQAERDDYFNGIVGEWQTKLEQKRLRVALQEEQREQRVLSVAG